MQNQTRILFIAQKTQLLLKPNLYFQVIFPYQVSDLFDVHEVGHMVADWV